jgi:hypothetical protein
MSIVVDISKNYDFLSKNILLQGFIDPEAYDNFIKLIYIKILWPNGNHPISKKSNELAPNEEAKFNKFLKKWKDEVLEEGGSAGVFPGSVLIPGSTLPGKPITKLFLNLFSDSPSIQIGGFSESNDPKTAIWDNDTLAVDSTLKPTDKLWPGQGEGQNTGKTTVVKYQSNPTGVYGTIDKKQITEALKNAGYVKISKTDSSKTDSSKTDSSKTDSSKTDSSKTDSSKTDSSKTDSSKTDSSKTDSSKTDSSKTDSSKNKLWNELSITMTISTIILMILSSILILRSKKK